MAKTSKHLEDILIQQGIVSPEELEEVLEKAKIRNLSLEEILFRLGYISRDKLGMIYAQAYGGDFLTSLPRVPNEELRMVPAEKALALQVVPYHLENETLQVLLCGPFEQHSFEETIAELERITGKKIHAVFCSSNQLQEMLQKHYPSATEKPVSPARHLASVIESIKSEGPDDGLRAEFEELYDVGQTALIGARSHPFNRAVAASIEEAKKKLADARKYMESHFEDEAVQMATQAVQLLKEATAKADAIEKDWDRLVQQVKALRAKVSALEEEGAAEFAASEFKELGEIRESLLECINDRNVDRLRYLLDQGMIISERVSLLSPNRNKSREQVIASLAQVRQVIARARKAGAKDLAPDLLNEAYGFLDRAEGSARRSRWDEVRTFLASAEGKAVEAEQAAARAAEQAKQVTLKLRDSIRAASTALEEAMTLAFAQEAIQELIRVKDSIAEAKTCFDGGRQNEGIALANQCAERLRETIIPFIRKAERQWKELFRRADESSAKIRTLDIPLMLKLNPMKVEALLHAERDMVASLCNRNRDQLAAAVENCESLLGEVEESYVSATDQLKNIEAVVFQAADLLSSAASSGIDADVAPAFVEAGLLLENARKYVADGNVQSAAQNASAAVEHLRERVIEPQRRVRELWSDLILEAAALLREAGEVVSLDACHRCPKPVELFYAKATDLIAALASREPETLRARISSLREVMQTIQKEVSAGQKELHQVVTAELRQIEQGVKEAVEKCSGYYAPDALESVYLDIKRLWEKLSHGHEALDTPSEIDIKRGLAVARAKLWQVEFLRERFEKEREEDLRQLRVKMDSVREEIERCASLDFVKQDSPLLEEARALLEQADNLLIEGDLEESFALVRQSRAALERLQVEAREMERRWKELVESLQADHAPHRIVLGDAAVCKAAPSEFATLSALAEGAAEVIARKDLDLLKDHCGRLDALAAAMHKRLNEAREQLRSRAQEQVHKAQQQIHLARILRAGDISPTVLQAACSFEEIALRSLAEGDFLRALDAAADAFTKAAEAVDLGKAGIERTGALAADYMKIASNHIEQGNLDDAAQALKTGFSLITSTRLSS